MVLRMTRPTRRSDSSFLQYRKRVPGDIQKAAYGQCASVKFPSERLGDPPLVVRTKLEREVKFSLQTRDPATAKERTGIATAQLERLYDAIRNGPCPLTRKQVVALAGLVYQGFAKGGEDDPGPASAWSRVVRDNQAAAKGDSGRASLIVGNEEDRRRASMEERFGAMADALLATQSIITDAGSRCALIEELERSLTQAAKKLRRNADGDYRPDPDAARFPPWGTTSERAPAASRAKCGSSVTFDELFERWRRERTPSPSTVTTWRGYVRALRKHLGHDDPSRVTKADIVAWKDALVAANYSPKGIKDGQLAAIRALYTYAIDNELLTANPAATVKVVTTRYGQQFCSPNPLIQQCRRDKSTRDFSAQLRKLG